MRYAIRSPLTAALLAVVFLVGAAVLVGTFGQTVGAALVVVPVSVGLFAGSYWASGR